MMLERKVDKEGKYQLYLSESWNVECKLMKNNRDVKLVREETVSVEVR